jgi:hypothetical protein
MWIAFIITNQVPEITIAPIKISYHLLAEFITSILLIIGGFGLFTKKAWGFHLNLIALGMLLYTVIVSAGYFANFGDIAMVGMFTLFQLLTILMIIFTIKRHEDLKI